MEMAGDGGGLRDKLCRRKGGVHARMRERRHRSPPLCHSGEFNEKIWAVKGRRRAVCHCGRLSIYLAFKHLADALVQSNSV